MLCDLFLYCEKGSFPLYRCLVVVIVIMIVVKPTRATSKKKPRSFPAIAYDSLPFPKLFSPLS